MNKALKITGWILIVPLPAIIIIRGFWAVGSLIEQAVQNNPQNALITTLTILSFLVGAIILAHTRK